MQRQKYPAPGKRPVLPLSRLKRVMPFLRASKVDEVDKGNLIFASWQIFFFNLSWQIMLIWKKKMENSNDPSQFFLFFLRGGIFLFFENLRGGI